MNRLPSPEEVEGAKSPAGGWTRVTLSRWGIGWPPPKGWRKELERAFAAEAAGADAEKVYRVCPYLAGRNLQPCKRCDPWRIAEGWEELGRLKRGCYALAEEVVNLVETGNAWRRAGPTGHGKPISDATSEPKTLCENNPVTSQPPASTRKERGEHG